MPEQPDRVKRYKLVDQPSQGALLDSIGETAEFRFMRILLLPAIAMLAVALVPSTSRAADTDPWFGRDKALHFGVSGLISSNGYLATRLANGSRPLAFGIGAGTAIAIGAAKELYDLSGRGDPSWKDFTWDVVGTGTGLLVAWAFDRLVADRLSEEKHALRIGDWNVRVAVMAVR